MTETQEKYETPPDIETIPARTKADVVEYMAHDGQAVRLNIDTCRKFLVRGKSNIVTNQEFVFFMGVCKSRGLNPFAMDAYLIKYSEKGNAAIIVSRGYYQAMASKQENCQGWRSGIVVKTEDDITYRQGHLILEGEQLVGGWAEATPKGWDAPKRHTVSLKPYIKRTYDGKITEFWSEDKQPMMIEKIAEVQLLRSIWSTEFANLYLQDEIITEQQPVAINGEIIDEGPTLFEQWQILCNEAGEASNSPDDMVKWWKVNGDTVKKELKEPGAAMIYELMISHKKSLSKGGT